MKGTPIEPSHLALVLDLLDTHAFSTTPTNLHALNATHTPKPRSPVHHGSIAEPSSLKPATTAKTGQRAAPSRATEANSRERRAG